MRHVIVATNYIDDIVAVVSSDGEILSRHHHLCYIAYLTFVVDHEAPIGSHQSLALKPTDQKESVIWHIY